MLLSRFWCVFVGLFIGLLAFMLFLAQSMYNRASARALGEALVADNQVVSWYLKNDARERAAQLIKFALNSDIARALAEASKAEAKVPEKSREQARTGLKSVAEKIAKDDSFDAVFAVDQHGRVVAHLGYEQASGTEDFELGGYPVVADALHGYVRDDTLLLDRIYRVVARPVEFDLGQMPAGAIVGARIIDERFARELSERTGAAVAFFQQGRRVAAGAPSGFEKTELDRVVGELPQLADDPELKENGVSQVHTLGETFGFIYGRVPGETWTQDAGYAVARNTSEVKSVFGFFDRADDKDKQNAKLPWVILLTVGVIAVGLGLSVLEYTRPLSAFRGEAQRLAKGEIDGLQPSRFRGAFRQLASDLNDGIEQAVAKGGGSRRAADLKQVIGDIPDQPLMSAFSFPGDAGAPSSSSGAEQGSGPISVPAGVPSLLAGPPASPRMPPPPPRAAGAEGGAAPPRPPAPSSSGEAVEPEWHNVYAEFVRTKQSCGETTEGLTFDKFKQTLKKNRDAIIQRHGVNRVKFSVYVKEGRAALKASPIRDA